MKALALVTAMIALICVVGCQKKDEAGAPAGPAPCPGAHVFSPYYGRCIPQSGCDQGLAVSAEQPSMCLNIINGNLVSPLKCGAGFGLTSKGCLPQGLCQPGQAQSGDVCVPTLQTNGFNNGSGYNNGYQQQQQMPGYYQPYMYYPNYYRPW